ncbi:MAG: threonine aldolase family protein [Pirellulales bacterium]
MTRTQSTPDAFGKKQFASDNYSGITPEAWEALQSANVGHAPAYGEDAWTGKACDLIRDFFETDCEVFFVFNGTAANSLVLSSMCQSYHSIICHEKAHVATDECSAPEFFTHGCKVLPVSGEHGKIDPQQAEAMILNRTDLHFPKPKALSITQSTELGTVYTPDELHELRELARRNEMHVHMDGARFAYALAYLNIAPKEITWQVGVDALCFGGTKIGMPVGDAVVFFNKDLAREFEFRCKQAGQLDSKMRFISASWIGMLESNAMLKYAQHANHCAQLLAEKLSAIPGLLLLGPVEVNACFVDLPSSVAAGLRDRGWHFYMFIGETGARLMCSWDTSKEDIDRLVADIRELSKELL